MSKKELNDNILNIAKKQIEIPNTGNLEDAEFLYKNWKLTDSNNTNAMLSCIGEEKGKKKFELMKRICALANIGGGILFWGINEGLRKV